MSLGESVAARNRYAFLLVFFLTAGLIAFAQGLGWATPAQPNGRGAIEPGAEAAAKKFLYAWSEGDRTVMLSLLAKTPKNYYGPCLFAKMPTLRNARRVEEGLGTVDFAGEATDPTLPKQGTILMNFKNLGSGRVWLVRGIIWKSAEAASLEASRGSSSVYDHTQDAAMQLAATKYLQAWQKEDLPAMQALTFDWLGRRKRPIKQEIIIRALELKPVFCPDGSVRVDFTVTVSPYLQVLRLIRRKMGGVLFAVKEEGEWKIRGITASF